MGAPQRLGNPVVSVSNIKYISGIEVFVILKNLKKWISNLGFFRVEQQLSYQQK